MRRRFGTRAAPAVGGVDFAKVALLLHCEGAHASTTFVDSGPLSRTSTAYGDAKISTSSPLVGAGSGVFDGSGDRVNFPHDAADDIGAGAFCIEASAKFPSIGGDYCLVFKGNYSGGYAEWSFIKDGSGYLRFYYGTRGYYQAHIRFLVPTTLVSDQKYDFCIARSVSGDWFCAVDGVPCTQYQTSAPGSGVSYGSIITGTLNNTVSLSASGPLQIAAQGTGSEFFTEGKIDEVRFVVGDDVHSSSYTVALPFPDS